LVKAGFASLPALLGFPGNQDLQMISAVGLSVFSGSWFFPVSTMPDFQPHAIKAPRARAVPNSRPFTVAVVFSALHYLGLIATLTAMVSAVVDPNPLAPRVVIAGLVFSGVSWLIAYFKRRSTYCPLCKGTPLINSGALPHVRAHRIKPFNHGVSAILTILATHRFRCMYCGSDYDLLKPKSRLTGRGPDDNGGGS